jgi:hypothetical protein
MISDITLSNGGIDLLVLFGSVALIVFFLGFYISYLLLRFTVKKTKAYFIFLYFLGGVLFAFVTYFPAMTFLGVFFTPVNAFTFPLILIVEISIISSVHYVFIGKKSKKKK